MRILYVNMYQSQKLLKDRPIIRGRTLAGSFKSLQISELLAKKHDVIILSEGTPTERSLKFYPQIIECISDINNVPVIYPSAIDIKYVGFLFSFITMSISLCKYIVKKRIECVIIYNMSISHILYAMICHYLFHVKIIIENEDDGFLNRYGKETIPKKLNKCVFNLIKKKIAGCFAVSEWLLRQFTTSTNKFLLPGIIAYDIELLKPEKKEHIFLYSGSLDVSKGIDALLDAWKMLPRKGDWKLHITGQGPLREKVLEAAGNDNSIIFHGLLNRSDYVKVLSSASVCINPHKKSAVPGNVYPFKITEYIAAGAVVITTPTSFDANLLNALIITKSDSPSDIKDAIDNIILNGVKQNSDAQKFVKDNYSYTVVGERLDTFLNECVYK